MAYEIDININGAELEGNDYTPSQDGTIGKQSDANKGYKALGKYIVGQTIQPIIQNTRSYVSQNIGMLTGSKELQERVNFAFQTIDAGLSLYNAGQAGVVLASSLGMSAGAGFGIGVGFALLNMGINIAFNQAQIDTSKRLEDAQIQQINRRGGLAFNKSRSN